MKKSLAWDTTSAVDWLDHRSFRVLLTICSPLKINEEADSTTEMVFGN